MQGIRRVLEYGYSLYDFEVYKQAQINDLHNMQFIKLQLTDAQGKLLSDNIYWHSNTTTDYTALSKMPKASVVVTSTVVKQNGKDVITANLKNSDKAIAVAVRLQLVDARTGAQLLPALMSDNYCTLLRGESKKITISLDETLVPATGYKLLAIPYNN